MFLNKQRSPTQLSSFPELNTCFQALLFFFLCHSSGRLQQILASNSMNKSTPKCPVNNCKKLHEQISIMPFQLFPSVKYKNYFQYLSLFVFPVIDYNVKSSLIMSNSHFDSTLFIQNSEIPFTRVEEQQAGDCTQVPESNHHSRTTPL